MKTLNLGICFIDDEGENVLCKRVVSANWSINMEQDMKALHNISIEEEIANVLVEQLKLSLTSEVVIEMLEEMKGS